MSEMTMVSNMTYSSLLGKVSNEGSSFSQLRCFLILHLEKRAITQIF